jgi:hypothetical protein
MNPIESGNKTETVDFHYVKTGGYRTYHVDGVFGGMTPKGYIYMELFVERAPTPIIVTQEINPDRTLGKETARQGKKGLIREVEAGVVVDLKTAELLRDWLTDKINQVAEIQKAK